MHHPRPGAKYLPTTLVLAVLAGCVAGEPSQGSTEKTMGKVRAALLAAGDADSLASAAELGLRQTVEERLALGARASAAAPDRADLAWLHLQWCIRVESCDVTPIESQLRSLDPGNAAAWSGSLERAAKENDTSRMQRLLELMAGAERFDIYWNRIIAHTADAMIRTHAIDAAAATVNAIGIGAAQGIPAFQPISKACRGKALEQPEVLDTCRRLSAVLRRGDTYITESFGLSLAMRLWPADSAANHEASEARRVLRYRIDTGSKLSAHFAGKEATSYLQLLRTHPSEQEAGLADITAAGLSPDPPPGWRESVLGGG
jgi:hypothetical protein